MELVLTPTATHLVVVLSGRVVTHDVEAGFARALAACRAHGLHRMLADLRGCRIDFAAPVFDTYLVMTRVARQYIASITAQDRALMLAVVMPAPLQEMDELGAHVASNRGLRTMVTTDLAAAAAWLGVEPPT